MYKVLYSYRAIENSNDNILKSQLHKLENSKENHFMEKSPFYENNVTSLDPDKDKAGKPTGTLTQFTFDPDEDPLVNVAHEMRHQFDHDIGNMQDDLPDNTAEDPSEIRGVYNENRGNDILNKSHRTKYGETEIDPKKLNNPPNNKQVKDVQK